MQAQKRNQTATINCTDERPRHNGSCQSYITGRVTMCLTYRVFLALIVLSIISTGCHAEKQHTLFENGKTTYRIVVSENPSGTEKYAAEQLVLYLKEISTADFPVVTDKEPPQNNEIVVGYNARADFLPDNFSKYPDGDESFTVYSQNGRIFIWGGKNRGTMYGAFSFLEQELGCRWYSSKVKLIPKRNSYHFTHINDTQSPKIQFRTVDYFDSYDARFSVPQKLNSQRFIRSQQPGGFERYWFEHSFDTFVPVAEFFDTHPEYFSFRDGERVKKRTQLCLTNPEVRKILTERLKKFIRENPQYRVYNVAQNDNKNPCLCDACQAMVEKYQAESGLMLWFVNQVAEEIEKEFPDEYIGTFAYQYTRKPPVGIKPRDNVMVVLCSIECDFSHPFSHPHNQKFVEDIENWSNITNNIFIWDYVVNYRHYLLPHPNFSVLAENIRFLKSYDVLGILEQANYQCDGGEFAHLRAYVLAKLLWNPDQKVRPLIEDFMNGYYGKSAPYILQYFDLVQGLVTQDSYITYATRLNNPIFTPEFLPKANKFFEQALAAAENEKVLKRVELAQLSVLYMNLATDYHNSIKRGELEDFKKITERENIVYTSEGMKAEEAIEYLIEENKNTE